MGKLETIQAVITGAGRGLGRAVARGFAREGATLYLCDRIDSPGIEGARWHQFDLREREACQRFVRDVTESSGGHVDVLVNGAGVLHLAAIEDASDQEWDETLSVNLTASFLMCRGFVPLMRERGGSVINVSSRAGVVGFAKESSYCASKFAVEGLTRALAAELEGSQVSVNTITPGLRIKPTMMTDAEESALPITERHWGDADAIVPAFILLALARGKPTGKRFEADKLSAELERQGFLE